MAKGPHKRERLSAITAARLAKAGKPTKVCDGGGLWLFVTSPTAASWVYRYRMNGVDREAGIGKFADVSLSDARSIAADMRRLKALGKEPLEERRRSQAMTFKACAAAFIDSQAPGWRNPKTKVRWQSSLRDYAYPVFGDLSVAAVDIPLVLRAIEPVWIATPETGRRLRLQIERVLDWATAHKYRAGDNPAAMKLLKNLLPSQPGTVEHHAALPVADVPGFIAKLHQQDGVAARALELTVLCATRTSETLNATWAEIDLPGKVWTIPANRMKSNREHRVPLSDRAVELLSAMKPGRPDGYVFKSAKPGRPLSNMAMIAVLRRMKRDDVTVHGMRSSFRDWAAENGYSREIAEAALAHAVGNKVRPRTTGPTCSRGGDR